MRRKIAPNALEIGISYPVHTLLLHWDSERKIMKTAFAAPAALLLAGISWSAAVQAQWMPQGSYLRSCADIGIQGDTLVAICRTGDGRSQQTALPAVSRCVGDIGNNNGNLQCNYDGGAQPYGQMPPPGYGPPR
jgi:hypothetical protein